MFIFVSVEALKHFKLVERRLQREMLYLMLNDANLSVSTFSGTISKLQITVSVASLRSRNILKSRYCHWWLW